MTFAERMDQYMDAYCKLYKFSGMLRVTHRDKIIYERNEGYANIEHKIPFSTSSRFTLYSMSKPLCVIGLMALADKGLVDIYAHPGKYLPEVRDIDPRITIKHLMHHISGLRDYGQEPQIHDDYILQHCPNMREAVKRMVSKPMNFEPGTDTRYSNINFTILALIIENISGMQYADYMKREVFVPLGMKNAQVDYLGLVAENRVQGYELNGDEIIATERVNPEFFIGAGDIITTIEDVYCLNLAIKHKKLLKPETWDLVLTPSDINIFGLGCMVWNRNGKKCIQHNGGSSGFRTLHIQLPEDDLDIILLSNFGFGDTRASLSNAVQTAFYGDFKTEGESEVMDKGFIQEIYRVLPEEFLPLKKPRVWLTPEEERSILGAYGPVSRSGPAYLTREGENYCFRYDGWRKFCCYPISKTVFANCFIDEAWELSIHPDGRVSFGSWIKLD